jgi:hypothetical protein
LSEGISNKLRKQRSGTDHKMETNVRGKEGRVYYNIRFLAWNISGIKYKEAEFEIELNLYRVNFTSIIIKEKVLAR